MITTKSFSQKKISILGYGVEGRSATRFLLQFGAEITICDKKNEAEFDIQEVQSLKEKGVTFCFGKYPDLSQFDYIVRSPGVPLTSLELQNIPSEKITSVTKIFFDLCPASIIGVTGTKGKGTTSSLIYEMVKASGRDAHLGGNIGTPALDLLNSVTPESIVILELSSFQLVDLHKSPHISVMLMVTAEHLDYHSDEYEYIEAKRNIVKYQSSSDFAILNKDYPASNESDIYTDAKLYFISRDQEVDEGCSVQNGQVVLKRAGTEQEILPVKDILLPGKHNWENVCAAVMAATLVGVEKKDIVSVLKSFKGLEHRLELVRTVKGVRYYDDSFSTTPETAEAALEAFDDPTVIILGGSSKNSDFTYLGSVINSRENIKAIIGIGEEWLRIKEQITDWHFQVIEGLKTMEQIVSKAAEITEPGDIVLLSPACASFDMFKDYKDRGNQFKEAVNTL